MLMLVWWCIKTTWYFIHHVCCGNIIFPISSAWWMLCRNNIIITTVVTECWHKKVISRISVKQTLENNLRIVFIVKASWLLSTIILLVNKQSGCSIAWSKRGVETAFGTQIWNAPSITTSFESKNHFNHMHAQSSLSPMPSLLSWSGLHMTDTSLQCQTTHDDNYLWFIMIKLMYRLSWTLFQLPWFRSNLVFWVFHLGWPRKGIP